MRIIGGTLRGHTLRTPRSLKIRPTTDQLRQSLFDVLGKNIMGSFFLDTYAGSGAVGIEAWSRGVEKIVLVESSRAALQVIRANINDLKLVAKVRVISLNVSQSLKQLAKEKLRFDTIFLDPPYEKVEEYTWTLNALGRLELLKPFGWVIAEHSKRLRLETRYGNLLQKKQLRRGDSQLSFYILDNEPGKSDLPH